LISDIFRRKRQRVLLGGRDQRNGDIPASCLVRI
jgi:hypothetical protein